MKIVIDIPKSMYEGVKIDRVLDTTVIRILDEIKNGTPLPKGHGRIADVDEAIKCIKDVEGEDAIWAISLIEWACAKRTIVEADKEESEEQA